MSEQNSNIKNKIYSILKSKPSNSSNATNFALFFMETKAFKLLLVFLFYFFLYELIRDILLFFDFTSNVLVHMYLSWMFVLFLLWALLPQKKSYI